MTSDPLDRLVAEILGSAKYRSVEPGLVRTIGARELLAHGRLKEAVKATKSKLHQVAGSYLDGRPEYTAWLVELAAARGEPEALRAICLRLMRQHASTRERLPILERFYTEALAGLPPPRTLLDLACGLNPLARAWMPFAPATRYLACDIYADLVDFVGRFLTIAAIPGRAFVCDLVAAPPTEPADLVLALKVLPVLEQIERGAALRLLRTLNAAVLLVSFPAASLGGRDKGMAANYERWFRELTASEPWTITRHLFPSELVFVVRKDQR